MHLTALGLGLATSPGKDAGTKAARIFVDSSTFAAVIGLAAAVASLSVAVAPPQQINNGLSFLAIALGGLGIAGGVVYLLEKLVNLPKKLAHMIAEYIIEKYKRHRWGAGRKAERRESLAGYKRWQEAIRNSQPFDELPPGYDEEFEEETSEDELVTVPQVIQTLFCQIRPAPVV